jgi:indole-3-glycerol phosphate synthase
MARDFLKEVLLEKQKSLKEQKHKYPEAELRLKLEEPRVYRPFKASISSSAGAQARPRIIAEIKNASPSEGVLRKDFNPLQIARLYQNAGSAAISILTEEKYFLGKIAYLNQVRKIVSLPILRKDFVFDPYQLYESKFFGADCVLLIAEILGNNRLGEFLRIAQRIELDCLVEVNTADDLLYALDQGAQIIGLNSRNLHTLEVDKKSARELIKDIPEDRVSVFESGIKTRRDYLSAAKSGAHALLIGGAFMTARDIKEKFKELVEGRDRKAKAIGQKKKSRKTVKPR